MQKNADKKSSKTKSFTEILHKYISFVILRDSL